MEPVQEVKARRDARLRQLCDRMPYAQYLGIRFDRRGDELTGVLPYRDDLIGNPLLPALHGGAVGAFLEITAQISLAWVLQWDRMEAGDDRLIGLPKTIDITVDYLRSGRPRDGYARARVTRSGRRYASVFAEAWQDNVGRPIAQASCHFLTPRD